MTTFPQQRFEYPNKDSDDLLQTILALESLQECEMFFRDLCTIQELKAMTERWSIAKLVHMGFPYRVISQKTGASSATIARVAHWLNYGSGGYQLVCARREELLKNQSVDSVIAPSMIDVLVPA